MSENPSMKKEYPELYNEMKQFELDDSVLDKILEVFDRWCRYCGSVGGSCQCMNDI